MYYIKWPFLLPDETKESMKSVPFQRSEARTFWNQVVRKQRLEDNLRLAL